MGKEVNVPEIYRTFYQGIVEEVLTLSFQVNDEIRQLNRFERRLRKAIGQLRRQRNFLNDQNRKKAKKYINPTFGFELLGARNENYRKPGYCSNELVCC